MRYPAVGEIWTNDLDWEFECFYTGDKGYGFERKHDGYIVFLSKDQWNDKVNYSKWEGPKTVSDVLCFYVTPANTIKATFYGDKNATGKPYYLKLMSDGELRVHEA